MTGRVLRHWLFGLMLATAAIRGWAAEPRLLVVLEEVAVSRQTAELLTRDLTRLGWTVSEATVGFERPVVLRPDDEPGLSVIVALGSRAFISATRQAAGRPVVGALISRSALDEILPLSAQRWSVVLLDQPPDRWANLAYLAFPSRQQVGLLVGPTATKNAHLLERRLEARGLSLATENVAAAEEVIPALERLLQRTNLLLALPDPLTHNRNTVQPVLLTTYRARVPVLAYSEAYQQAGAVLTLYSTVPQIVAQVIETLRQVQDGKALLGAQLPPRYFTVGINTSVARSLGLHLPAAGELQEKLRSLEP
jgi:putative tryptophan/tyrosine transport system substrate-binding protein